MDFRLTSPAFADGANIPEKYTCKGDNLSPPLGIVGTPDGTASLALIMHDPDAPGGDFLHWTLWGIPADTTVITENSAPLGASSGATDFGAAQYGGPCPPSGTHHYVFDLYALNLGKLPLKPGASRREVEAALQGHILAQTSLTGVFSV